MFLLKTRQDCACHLSQLGDVSSEGPALHVAHDQAMGVLRGSWCSWPGSASASVPRKITSSSLPTKENLFSSFTQIFNSSHGPF